VTRLSFATTVCPPWLLGPIQRLSGRHGAGTWAVTAVPGGTGDWGGFYLAIPRASAHQQDAYQLAVYLSGQQAGPALAGHSKRGWRGRSAYPGADSVLWQLAFSQLPQHGPRPIPP